MNLKVCSQFLLCWFYLDEERFLFHSEVGRVYLTLQSQSVEHLGYFPSSDVETHSYPLEGVLRVLDCRCSKFLPIGRALVGNFLCLKSYY